jgi:GNAT superfamily N-acetyltransferase
MDEVTIRQARRADTARLDAALRALSQVMGDVHRAGESDLLRAGFGPCPAFSALLAERADGRLVGAALVSPLFSTTRGMAGAFVSDLWVDDAMRGQGLGRRLLAAARDLAAGLWGAGFLRLAVYDDNPRARAFYDRLGFVPQLGVQYLTLERAALAALEGAR